MERRRRVIAVIILTLLTLGGMYFTDTSQAPSPTQKPATQSETPEVEGVETELATSALEKLAIKGRAPKTDYAREQFGSGWAEVENCDMREYILQRDLKQVEYIDNGCTVGSGVLNDPYTGKVINFQRGTTTSQQVQIDHVVALSDAWQKGAQVLDVSVRAEFANDPLNLLAVDGPTNSKKSDSDAASWLPPNKDYRCRFVARQIAVKAKYELWVTQAEHDTMKDVLNTCPTQVLPIVQ